MGRADWQKWASVAVCTAALLLLLWVTVRYLLGIFLPFIVAWCVALAVTPAAKWLRRRTGLPFRLWAVILLILALGALVLLITLAADRLIFELERLLGWLKEMSVSGELSERVNGTVEWLRTLAGRIPFLGELADSGELESFRAGLRDMLMGVVSDALGRLGSWLPSAALGMISYLPSVMLALTVTLIACFYFALDLDAIHAALASLLPRRTTELISGLRSRVFVALLRWLRAYAVLFSVTFAELFVGFLILGVDYALLLALIGALIDIMPVLGTGIILIPWSVFSLLTHNFYLGFGLLILYVVITVIRQVAEPHIVGGSLGIHPLLMLVAMYVGFRLFGVAGMLLLPAALMLIRAAGGVSDNTDNKDNKNKC